MYHGQSIERKHFFRTGEKTEGLRQEVDFLVADRRKPLFLVEAKLNDEEISPALKSFQAMLGVPAIQLVDGGETFRKLTNGKHHILVAPACQWLSQLP